MKSSSQYQKRIFMLGLIVIVLLMLAYWQRQVTLSNGTETKLKDEPRKNVAVAGTFYSDQLTVTENVVYEQMKAKLIQKEGGVLEFEEPLDGREYLRVTTALEDEGYNYYYGFYDIPMNAEDIYVKYKNPDLTAITEKSITKAILFLYSAEGINESGEYGEDGRVENLMQVQEGLSINVNEKVQRIEKTTEETEQVLQTIMEGLSKDAGEKTAIDYFLNWLDANLSLAADIKEEAATYTTMDEVFDGVTIYNNLSALTKGKATSLGYAKILTELCNRSGIESHIVLGAWGKSEKTQESYVLSAVKVSGQTIYIDASGSKAEEVGFQRYLSEEEAKVHMKFVEYFEYK